MSTFSDDPSIIISNEISVSASIHTTQEGSSGVVQRLF